MTSNLKNVPLNWQKVRFDEIAEIVTDRIEKPIESGLSDYIGLEHLDTDCIRIKRFGSTEDVDATKFLCKKGDIIFGKRRAYLRKLAVSDREAVVSAHSMVLRSKGNKIYPDFLPCFMQSSIFWKTAHSISEGSMSPTIKWKTLAAQEFWLPSIEEQKKISELLWSIEDNIQKTEKLIETTEKLKQRLLNELLTKGIGHTQFKDSELGKIPAEWEVATFSDAVLVNPKRKLIKGTKAPYVSMADLIENQEKIISCSEKEYKSGGSKFKNGDTLLARITPCLENGKTAYLDILNEKEVGFGSTEFIVLTGTEKKTLNKYVYYLATSPFFRKKAIDSMIGTTGRQRVPNNIFNKIKILIPSLSEQEKIVEVFEKLNVSIKENNNVVNQLNSLKKKLTNDLISGK